MHSRLPVSLRCIAEGVALSINGAKDSHAAAWYRQPNVSDGSTSAGQPTMLAVRYADLSRRPPLEWRVRVRQLSAARADWTSGLGHRATFSQTAKNLTLNRIASLIDSSAMEFSRWWRDASYLRHCALAECTDHRVCCQTTLKSARHRLAKTSPKQFAQCL
jgi:hypothetical protein